MPGLSDDGADALDRLAARAAGGDAAALDDLLVTIEPRVQRIAGRMLLHPQDAEEAAQDALFAVSRKIATYLSSMLVGRESR